MLNCDWQGFWEFYGKADAERRAALARGLGYVIENGQVRMSHDLKNYLDSCPAPVLEGFLLGAPIEFTEMYWSVLPSANRTRLAQQLPVLALARLRATGKIH